jgi:hypothetical protein
MTRVRSIIAWAALPLAFSSLKAAGAEPVRSVEIVESGAFLEGYRAASEAQSADFYDRYSDRAVIHVRLEGHEQGMGFQGRAFKIWGRQLLKAGKTGLDGSIFHEPTVEQRGNRLLIRAKRYSTTRCYWDLNYQVGIEREGTSYRIVDERLTLQPEARCRPEHSQVTVAPKPPPVYFPVTSADALRPFDSEASMRWRPLSQQELADKAMQLAQQMAAARGSQSPPIMAAKTASLATQVPLDSSGVASRPVPTLVELRVTPED